MLERLDECLVLYEATGNEEYLDEFKGLVQEAYEAMNETNKDVELGYALRRQNELDSGRHKGNLSKEIGKSLKTRRSSMAQSSDLDDMKANSQKGNSRMSELDANNQRKISYYNNKEKLRAKERASKKSL